MIREPRTMPRVMVRTTGLHVRVGDWLRSDPTKAGLREIDGMGLRWDRDSQTLAIRVYYTHVSGQADKGLLGPDQPITVWRKAPH